MNPVSPQDHHKPTWGDFFWMFFLCCFLLVFIGKCTEEKPYNRGGTSYTSTPTIPSSSSSSQTGSFAGSGSTLATGSLTPTGGRSSSDGFDAVFDAASRRSGERPSAEAGPRFEGMMR